MSQGASEIRFRIAHHAVQPNVPEYRPCNWIPVYVNLDQCRPAVCSAQNRTLQCRGHAVLETKQNPIMITERVTIEDGCICSKY
jgi:hypothetical protein